MLNQLAHPMTVRLDAAISARSLMCIADGWLRSRTPPPIQRLHISGAPRWLQPLWAKGVSRPAAPGRCIRVGESARVDILIVRLQLVARCLAVRSTGCRRMARSSPTRLLARSVGGGLPWLI
jgi:hypothetical protein